ncbi:MAG TPA: hypothetical protein VFW87_07465 [Pirellulales bacterium]|nr:hypothetical protein [Pirellulales bacterium]
MKPRSPASTPPAASRRASPLLPQGAVPLAAVPSNDPPVADPAQKTWEVHSASGVPAPVIRANMISLRLSFQGGVKVTFFEQG